MTAAKNGPSTAIINQVPAKGIQKTRMRRVFKGTAVI
jgi:hypothetical protein